MADIRVNALPTLGTIAAEDILHILDASTTDDVDSQTTVDAVADWIIANKSVRITGIDDVPGLRAALDGKADIVHTHTIAQVIGLQADLDAKTDVTQAQIIGRNIVLNGKSINVPSTIGGLQDDRIPDTVIVGDYLQFGTTTGGINNITGDVLKGNLALNLVDNTTDISKPVSTAQQSALDLKVDTTTYNTGQTAQDETVNTLAGFVSANAAAAALNTQKISFDTESSTKLAGIEAGADVTDTTNVWSSLGISSSGSTSQFLTQRGVFVDPVGNAGLLNEDNTWTGVNTFSNTAGIRTFRIYDEAGTHQTLSHGSLNQVQLGNGDDTVINSTTIAGKDIYISSPVRPIARFNGSVVTYNPLFQDLDFVVRGPGGPALDFDAGENTLTIGSPTTFTKDIIVYKETSGDALRYDARTDTLSTEAANIVGFGGSDGGAADSIVRQPNGSTVDPMKVWTGTKAQYDALTPDADTLYSTTDESNSGAAVLADDQTFTGRNTFTDTAIFSDGIGTDGSIQVASRIVHLGDTDTFIGFFSNEVDINTGGFNACSFSPSDITMNSARIDMDFEFRKATSGNAIHYDFGTDTLSTDAANLEGIADQETGTWTPNFQFAGTQGATTATYSRVGNTVVASCEAVLAAGTIAFNFAVTTASLPFTTSASSLSVGTFFNAATGNVTSPVEGGTVIIVGTDLRFFDKGSTTNVKGTDLLGYLSFTITYQTT